MRNAAGEIIGVIVSFRDITERKQNEEKLHLAASVFTSAREGIMITEPDGTIIDVNNTFSQITGYSRKEVIGHNPRMLSSGRYDKDYYTALWRDLIEKGHWYGEIWNRHKNGKVYAEMQNISAVRDAHGNTKYYVSLFSDITLIKDHQQELEYIAHYDALTNLPNRVLLVDRLQQAMPQALRRELQLVVVFLDLDGFKAINDNHGHKAGDQLLVTVALSMKQTLREGDTLARLGGDEFVAVLTDLIDIEASVPMLTRLLSAAAQPVHIGDLVLQVSASLGATAYPQLEDIDADQLLRQADQAMYQAKLAGKNRYHIFDAAHDNSIRVRHENLDRIREAIIKQEFVLYYQPKVNMRTGAIIGAEALIRWNHPEKGLLSPALFLPEIEDHPLAIELGEWVINTALTQIELWRNQGFDIQVSVNVGARQLQQDIFVTRLCKALASHPDIMPSYLELEVLETSALEDIAKASLLIDDCRKLGVSFALDDFGTGYSSLTYLRRLPVALLKIDQSFVRDMLNDLDDLAIIEGIVGLARTFRRKVIAEGVETVEHGTLLLKLGCDMAQGYGIARPMPADHLPKWSLTWRPDSAWVDQPLMSHDELPLLFASIEQRSWIAAIEAFLKGERDAPLPIDPYQSRLSMWLNIESLANYCAQPAFEAIDSLYRQTQMLSTELCELQTLGRNAEALARLSELHDLGDALIEQLKVPMQKIKH
jgi:diguanylate cyclase (GGDEF)-like protein/PAS domain S-box-containing protein